MLGYPVHPAVLGVVTPCVQDVTMASDNRSGGDDQQETAKTVGLDAQWVCGFVDGEGCFSVSIHRNPVRCEALDGR
jgi:hypothetical protein